MRVRLLYALVLALSCIGGPARAADDPLYLYQNSATEQRLQAQGLRL